MPEGVLNNVMDDDRLLRNNPDHSKSLLQDVCVLQNVSQFTLARLAVLVVRLTTAGMLRSGAVRAAYVWSGFMVMSFFLRRHEQDAWALCFGEIDCNLICLEALEGEISNLVARKIRRLQEVEAKTSTLPVEQAHASTASIHKFHPMMGCEMIARRSMLHL